MSRLNYFLEIFEKDVASAYQLHEATFDIESFHGRFHILRCLFLVDKLDEYYKLLPIEYDIDAVYYAILFHDIARKNNGIDIWESESANTCYQYLIRKGFGRDKAYQTSQLILKKTPFSIEGQIVYDVDVLDYYRFFTFEEELVKFDRRKLLVGSMNDVASKQNEAFRNFMMDYALRLVRITEEFSISLPTNELITSLQSSLNDF